MALLSQLMNLQDSERHWLPWFGPAGKLRMGWACWLNQNRYAQLEEIFTNLSTTRVRLLQQWCDNQWSMLGATRLQQLSDAFQVSSDKVVA